MESTVHNRCARCCYDRREYIERLLEYAHDKGEQAADYGMFLWAAWLRDSNISIRGTDTDLVFYGLLAIVDAGLLPTGETLVRDRQVYQVYQQWAMLRELQPSNSSPISAALSMRHVMQPVHARSSHHREAE